ncbi:MAG TPA: LysR family transcriptional regulator [Albitalea sp.]|uniref:LysR family transcriptional regulator n=1 Tax=Piscinibacter sp. TaxID=1903157 RepID=UPI002ED36465
MAIKELDFRKIDLNLLVVFHAIEQERSVARAAQRLYLGPSAVSMSLRRLRELFGDELFVRAGARMAPTARAEALAPQVLAILEAARGLVYRGGASEPLQLDRVFRLGASEACEAGTVAAVLAELRAQAPRARLVVRPLDYMSAADMLDAAEIELAVGYLRDMPARHVSETLCHHSFACVYDPRQVHCAAPITLDDYLGHDHVLVSQRGDLEGVVDEPLRQLGQARRVVASTSRFSVIPSWLTRSPLIATLASDIAIELALNHGLVCSALPLAVDGYDIHMCWHRRDENNPSAAWFRALVRRVAGDDAHRAQRDAVM